MGWFDRSSHPTPFYPKWVRSAHWKRPAVPPRAVDRTALLEQIMQAQQRELDAARVMEQVFGPIKDPDLRRRLDDEDAIRAFFGG